MIFTKKNEQMAFIKVTDFSGTIEAVIFPRILTEFKNLLALESCISIKGRISHRNDSVSIVAEKIKAL
jgi:DNA polymerase-3 subunit alpha